MSTSTVHREDELALVQLEGLAHFHQLAWTMLEMLEKAAAGATAARELFEIEGFLTRNGWRPDARVTGGDRGEFVDGLPPGIVQETDELVSRMSDIDAKAVQEAAEAARSLYVQLEIHLRDRRRYLERILATAPVAEELKGGGDA